MHIIYMTHSRIASTPSSPISHPATAITHPIPCHRRPFQVAITAAPTAGTILERGQRLFIWGSHGGRRNGPRGAIGRAVHEIVMTAMDIVWRSGREAECIMALCFWPEVLLSLFCRPLFLFLGFLFLAFGGAAVHPGHSHGRMSRA
jgi:hypothetical protein